VHAWVRGWSDEPETDDSAVEALFALESDAPVLTPEQQQARLLRLIWRIQSGSIGEGPVFVVFEDVQWADEVTLGVIERALDHSATKNVMVVITHRSDFHLPASSKSHATTLSIGRLTRSQCETLVQGLCERRPLPEAVVDRILERADGVPAYLTELTRAVLATAGELRNDSLVVPETLHDSLAAQLDRLEARPRELAQVAAALGREFSGALLRRVYAGGKAALEEAMGVLVREGILVAPAGDADSHHFRHGLIRDVAYQSLLKRTRRALHDQVASVLLEELTAAAQADPEQVAWHLERAGRATEASRWWAAAATRAAQRAAVREAVGHYRRAIEVLEEGLDPEDSAATEELAEMLVSLATQLRLSFPLEEAHEAIDRAEALATRHDLAATLSRVWFTRGNLAFRAGDTEACLAAHTRAREEAVRAGSAEAEAQALGGLADAHLGTGRFVEAAKFGTQCVEMANAHGFVGIAAANGGLLAYLLHWCLRPALARQMAGQAAAQARECNNVRALANALQGQATLLAEAGDYSEARRTVDELHELDVEPFLRHFGNLARSKILRGEGLREESDRFMRARRDEMPSDFVLRMVFSMAAAGTLSESDYQAALVSFEQDFWRLAGSNFRLTGIMEGAEVAIYRRDFAAMRKLYDLARDDVPHGQAPIVDVTLDMLLALTEWSGGGEVEVVHQCLGVAREGGLGILVRSVEALLTERAQIVASDG
jgi:tetratricopeptide (TPR) repeat protein